MNWNDMTSYHMGDVERIPRVLECRLSPNIAFTVHKHIYFGDVWLLSSRYAGFDNRDLGTNDMAEAKKKATAIMVQVLKEKRAEIDTALHVFCDADSKPAQWIKDENGIEVCSHCRKAHIVTESGYHYYSPFCPNCGFPMLIPEGG